MGKEEIDLMNQLFKQRFKKSTGIVDLDAVPAQGTPGLYIPTGSLALDLALGVGGFKRGTVSEIFGQESSGKSTLTVATIASAQQMFPDQPVALIDVEHAYNKDYADEIGVNHSKSRFKLVQESETEDGLNAAFFFAEQGVPLIVVDSVAALVPQAQLESGNSTDRKMGGNSTFLSSHLPQMIAVCGKTGSTVIYVNQIREKVGVMFGNPETTPGGRALKFYASLRIETRVSGKIDEDGQTIGVNVTAKVIKNKIGGAPYRKATYPIIFGQGIDHARELGDIAIERGLLGAGSGGRYQFGDTKLHGKSTVYEYLEANPEVAKALTDTIWSNAA